MSENDKRFERIEEEMHDLGEKMDRIEKDLAKYRGMVGGVLLVITALVTFLKMSWGFITEHLSWQ